MYKKRGKLRFKKKDKMKGGKKVEIILLEKVTKKATKEGLKKG